MDDRIAHSPLEAKMVWPSKEQLDALAYDGSGHNGLLVLRSAEGKYYKHGMGCGWFSVSDVCSSTPDLCGAHVWEKRTSR